jgi:hypothetical protein
MQGRPIRLPVLRGLPAGLLALGAWCASSCAPSGFQDEAQLQGGVRILASSADLPYAAPGSKERVSVLAYDGRPASVRSASPMHVFWFPVVCENPPLDAYYGCFPQFANLDGGTLGQVVSDDASPGTEASAPSDAGDDTGTDAGTDAGAGPGTDADAGPGSPLVSSFQFAVPENVVSSHAPTPGATPYGLMIAFNFACAGHLQLLPGGSGNPQAPPIGCADDSGNLLGPDSYVFGYTRVYVYSPDSGVTNTNPVVDCVDARGTAAAEAGAAGPGPCVGAMLAGAAPSLTVSPIHVTSPVLIGPHVTPESWEPAGNGIHEEIWVDYYSTFGTFTHDARLLYDPMVGLIGPPGATDTEFDPPIAPANPDGYVWMVVHDNRGGAVWITVPVHVGP